MRVSIAVREARAIDDHAVVEQGALALRDRAQPAEHIGELLDVEAVDVADFHVLRVVALVVGERVVAVVHADVAVAAVRSLICQHEGAHARHVGLERQHHHVAHQLRVLLVALGDVFRHLVAGRHGGIRRNHLLRALDAQLDLADGGEIFVELLPVAPADLRAQRLRVFEDEIQDALVISRAPLLPLGLRLGQLAGEKPLEDQPRIDLARHRRGFVAPRDVVGIRARIAAVAFPRGLAGLEAEFQRGKARVLAEHGRRDLIGGDAHAHVRALAFQRLRAGEPAPRRARVIAAAVAVRAAAVLREAAEHEQLVLMLLERREDVGQLEIRADRGGRPVRHVSAIRHEHERHAQRRGLAAGGERAEGEHRVEHRQRDGGADAAEEGAAGDVEFRIHGGVSFG